MMSILTETNHGWVCTEASQLSIVQKHLRQNDPFERCERELKSKGASVVVSYFPVNYYLVGWAISKCSVSWELCSASSKVLQICTINKWVLLLALVYYFNFSSCIHYFKTALKHMVYSDKIWMSKNYYSK